MSDKPDPSPSGASAANARTVFYNFSGGMESAAMLVLERERILDTKAIVQWADTGKHFPEMAASIAQVGSFLGLPIISVPRRISFDEFLFERGGMVRKGTNDCSRRMKRSNLSRHIKSHPRPYEVNLGYNAAETQRADKFSERNERPWLNWRFPLIEHGVYREQTEDICTRAGFSVLVEMYRKMGRFDCYFCGNQTDAQALRVVEHYPDTLAVEWLALEERKGHGFRPVRLKALIEEASRQPQLPNTQSGCACFGGDDDFAAELEAPEVSQ